jgi:hypothetical protein
MQLWGRRQDENPDEFWRKTGERRGGTIGLFTFATLLGRSGDGPMGLPGLLYTVGDRVWFEDFERDNWLSKILGSRQKYEKTELSFDRTEVAFSRVVSRGGAYRCIGGRVAPDALSPMSGLGRLFSAHALQVGLRDSSSVFLEILREEEFRSFLGK